MRIVNRSTYRFPAESGGDVTITAILTEGVVEDLAAYAGHLMDWQEPQWLLKHGEKLSWQQARFFFPLLPRRLYRR